MAEDGVKIQYGDVAPEAKENFTPSVSDKADFVDLAQLQKYNLQFLNYANPCEYGSVLLDSSASAFPAYPSAENMGLWSGQISGEDGSFLTPIVLTLESSGQYSSQGITFTFDTFNSIFCNELNIKWYRNGELIEDADFQPNSAFYFCRKKVENYDKLVITISKINMPYNRLKLRAIDYGYGTFFYGNELRNVKVIQEIDPISSEIAIGTIDFTLNSKSDMEYSFQSKQALSVYFNDSLKATCFVTKSKRKSKNQWEVNAEDYVGQLDKITFLGGMYTEQNASDLLASMLTQAKVPFSIADSLSEKTVTGYIPICTCRDALRQICFAIGAVASAERSTVLKIYELSDGISQHVALTRIRQGQNFDDGERVTEVRLTQHTYKQTEESVELYKASESGTGTDILVRFSEPAHSLSITKGTITSSGANYAVITAESGCILSGKRYEDNTVVTAKRNPVVSASDLENVVEITDATLISKSNAETILQKAFDYLIKTNRVNLEIIDGRWHVKYGQAKFGQVKYMQYIYDQAVELGDVLTADTEYLGSLTGRIVSVRYNLNGGILVKECELV